MRLFSAVKRLFSLQHDLFRGSFYRNSLSLFLLTACVPIAAIGIINYFVGSSQIKSELTQSHVYELNQEFSSMERQLMQLESAAYQEAFSPIFYRDIKDMDLRIDFERYFEIIGELNLMQSSNPLVQRVSLYLKNVTGPMEISYDKGIIDLHDGTVVAENEKLLGRKDSFFWVNSSELKEENAAETIVLICRIQGNVGEPYAMLKFYLSTQVLDEDLGQLNPDGEGAAFILDSEGNWIAQNAGKTDPGRQLNELIRKLVVDRNDQSFTCGFQGENYLVTVGTMTENSWRFVVATKLSKLMGPVRLNGFFTIATCVVILALAILLSLLASSRVYRPIRGLMDSLREEPDDILPGKNEIQYIEEKWEKISRERGQLLEKLEASRDSMKKEFLLQLLQGRLWFVRDDEVLGQFRQYCWEPEDRVFSVLLIKIILNHTEITEFSPKDGPLVTFACCNIAEELVANCGFDTAVANFHDLSLAVLVSCNKDREDAVWSKELMELSKTILQTIRKSLDVAVTIAVGKTTTDVSEVCRILEEAQHALGFRDMSSKGQIIDLNSGEVSSRMGTKYPFANEKNVISALKAQEEELAATETKKFIEKLKNIAKQEFLFRQGLMQLLGSILHFYIKSGIDLDAISPNSDLYDELWQLNNTEEIVRWFQVHIIIPYIHELGKEEGDETEQAVSHTIEYIKAKYDTPISLESCAELVKMPPYSLSLKFKQVTGENFIDYLTRVRLEEAKRLLRESQLTVSEVAGKVGYQPTYFVRIFKKVETITPGQYRESSGK